MIFEHLRYVNNVVRDFGLLPQMEPESSSTRRTSADITSSGEPNLIDAVDKVSEDAKEACLYNEIKNAQLFIFPFCFVLLFCESLL